MKVWLAIAASNQTCHLPAHVVKGDCLMRGGPPGRHFSHNGQGRGQLTHPVRRRRATAKHTRPQTEGSALFPNLFSPPSAMLGRCDVLHVKEHIP